MRCEEGGRRRCHKSQVGEEVSGYIVCEEQHKDGTPHLHVFLQFREKKTFCKEDCFDFIGGSMGIIR